jgi:hypothetical protein
MGGGGNSVLACEHRHLGLGPLHRFASTRYVTLASETLMDRLERLPRAASLRPFRKGKSMLSLEARGLEEDGDVE